MYNVCFYFLMFFCYAVGGWLVECVACSFNQKRFVHDRGFLIGPYCPIYGLGALYAYFFLARYHDDILVLFLMTLVGTSILEYFTSFLMEKMFHARWWDYSNQYFNLNGRICLKNAILFGLMGIVFIYLLNPFFMEIVAKIPKNILIIISISLFLLFLIDVILSFNIMNKLKRNLTDIHKDSSSDIDRQVREILSSNTFYLKKLFRSFPTVTISLPKGEKIRASIYRTIDNFDKLRKKRKKRVKEIKESLDREKK